MAWDPASQKIVLFTYPMSDGAGDFSTTKKMIEKLLSMEIRPENIYLVIVNLYNMIDDYKKIESELKKNCDLSLPVIENENVNIDFGQTRIIGDKDKIIKDDSNFTITDDIYRHISEILNYLCIQYNKTFEPKTDCGGMDESYLSLSDMKEKLYNLIKDVKHKYTNIRREIRKEIKEEIEQEIKQEDSEYKYDPTKIEQKIRDRFSYRCTLKGEILNKFLLSGMDVKFWYTWIKNVSSFLMPFKAKGVNLKIILSRELGSLKKTDLTDDNILILSINNVLKKSLHSTFSDFKILSFGEGGFCNNGVVYSPGYSEDVSNKKNCLGINITNTAHLEGPSGQGNYNFCYFGKVNENETSITPYGLLMMHKLKYLILMEETSHIKINKSCFDLILKYKSISDVIFGDIKEVSENVLVINGKHIEFYDVLDSLSFLNSLNKSKIYCVLTCDQSYFEGISLGKIVLFDLHKHKKQLSLQMLKLYNHLSGEVNELPNIDWIDMFEKNSKCVIRSHDEHSFTFATPGYKDVKFEYSMIKDFYDKILVICSFLKDPAKREFFLERLKTDFNFDKNFEALIKGESHFKSKKKSLKKSKKMSLKKSKKMSLKKSKKTSLKKAKKTSLKKAKKISLKKTKKISLKRQKRV